MPAALKTAHLTLPATTTDLARLELGTVVHLAGRVFTAREGVYKRAVEDGAGLPAAPEELGSANFHCSPAATLNPDGSATVGAVTATASFRFAKWLDGWFRLSRCNIIIGKGGMTSEIYKRSFVPHKAIYLTTVGYGTGALLGRGPRTLEERPLHHAARVGIQADVHAIDGRVGRMRLEIQQNQRAQRLRIPHRRGQRNGPHVNDPGRQVQGGPDGHRAPVGQLQPRRERLQLLIAENRVRSVFHPIVRIADREVVGHEALTRPLGDHGFESVEELFAFAESTDLLSDFERLCRSTAIRSSPQPKANPV